ncbi:HEAT repeat domain-containing protein [bacterium]|nr:HEAT repeat domain-containing protein [bacterium]
MGENLKNLNILEWKIRQTIKTRIAELLAETDLNTVIEKIRSIPPKKVLNFLIPQLVSIDEELKWRTVTIAGMITSDLADRDMEAARIFIRRMIWNLTEESGNCPWGAPEYIAEVLADHRKLAEEYSNISVSLIMPDGNFSEYEPLLRGAVWGVGRIAEIHPDLVADAVPYLCDLLASSDDMYIKGFSCRALGLIGDPCCLDKIEALLTDNSMITLYRNRELQSIKLSELAREALQKLT